MYACSFLLVVTISVCAGCSRQDYRLWADRDAAQLVQSRQVDPSWTIPFRAVEADPTSRMADYHDPDCGPVPDDDPSAHCYMLQPFHSKPITYWNSFGTGGPVENDLWMDHLPFNDDGEIELTQQSSIDLALLHSRDYQSQVESLYLTALGLSQDRFEFALNWFGGSDIAFGLSGDGTNNIVGPSGELISGSRDLSVSNQLGFNRNLAAGGQLAVSLANSFIWQFGGGTSSYAGGGNLLVSLTQPLLRGAYQHVRTESLTQSERSLLYAVRDFARFRRQFYLNTVSQYLDLLNQSQGVRIEEENLRNQLLNLEEHRELLRQDLVSQIQVDQFFQSYQTGRLRVINVRQGLDRSLDLFKNQLGLPAKIPLKIDETILQQFQLNSPELSELRDQANALEQDMIKYLPPEKAPLSYLKESYDAVAQMLTQVERIKPEIEMEFEEWLARLDASQPTESTNEDDRIEHEQQSEYAERIKKLFQELDQLILETRKDIVVARAALDKGPPEVEPQPQDVEPDIDEQIRRASEPDEGSFEEEAWKTLQALISRKLQEAIGSIFVAQTQIRLFAIEIETLDFDEQHVINIALDRRLDLKNAQAQVVDAYRGVEIAADALESDLDFSASADLRTDSIKDNPVRFDAKENQYNLGLRFDGPLNRFGERNSFRAAQIAYQQARRAYMSLEDAIVNDVRQDLRQLVTNRYNFQITRQSLIAATRQVDEAQLNLRAGGQAGGDSSLTQDLLLALNGLRDAQNNVITSWFNYEVSRIRLFVDLELLMLDENGVWINEQENSLSGNSDADRRSDPDRLEFERIFDGDGAGSGDQLNEGQPADSAQPAPLPFEPESASGLSSQMAPAHSGNYYSAGAGGR